jgi:hypothetical protein
MKTTKYFLMTMLLSVLLMYNFSCSDSFLDEKPYSLYAPETLTDEKGIEASLKGLHRIYGELWTWSDQQGWLSCWQLGTDVGVPGGIQGIEVPFYDYATLVDNNAGVKYMWQKCYQVINNANVIIAAIGESGDPAKLAEARFFRGYMYNHLVTLYGAVPLLLDPTSSAKTDYTRTSVAEVDVAIVADLKYASENLPGIDKLVAEGRANKYMAMQALGEVYLRTGNPSEAEKVLTTIIADNQFSLIKARYGTDKNEPGDYFHDMFIYGNQRRSQGNAEAIWTFELEYNKNVAGGFTNAPQHRRVYKPAYHNVPGMRPGLADSLGGRGNGRMGPSNWVKYQLYQEGDMRNSEYNIKRHFYYNNDLLIWPMPVGVDKDGWRVATDSPEAVATKSVKLGDPVVVAKGDTVEYIFPHTTKWNSWDVDDEFGWECIKDFPIMRLGETYLLRAEARFKNNNASGAAADINVLRERAFPEYPAKGQVNASQITLDFILDERARELYAEENRRMTLVRTGTLVERAALNPDVNVRGKIAGLTKNNLLLPIPYDERMRNKDAILEQNPGY